MRSRPFLEMDTTVWFRVSGSEWYFWDCTGCGLSERGKGAVFAVVHRGPHFHHALLRIDHISSQKKKCKKCKSLYWSSLNGLGTKLLFCMIVCGVLRAEY